MDFEDLYVSYFEDVFRYILSLAGDVHVAEDITSDTFLKALRGIRGFRGQCDVRVWLCQIAKNCYFSYLRKEKHLKSVDMDTLQDYIDPAPLVEDLVVCEADREYVRAVLMSLPEPYREVLMWRVYAQLSFRQIGQIFQKSDNWACVTYYRGRKMMKDRLEEWFCEK